MKYLLAGFMFLLPSYLVSHPKPSVILECRDEAGLFSTFTDVIGMLQAYEDGLLSGLRVDFGKKGVYYQPSHGENWWSYYCEPIELGILENPTTSISGKFEGLMQYRWKNKRALHDLIVKHIRFNPDITERVAAFQETHFENQRMIGVHYRGTDWVTENGFRKVGYRIFARWVRQILKQIGSDNVKVFIATDELAFIDYMRQTFPGKVCFVEDSLRSTSHIPLHKDQTYNHFLQGQEAIIDCLLLSKCEYLVGSCSNLSQWATFFNPECIFKDLSPSPVYQIHFEE